MEFDLSAEQRLLQQTLRRFFTEQADRPGTAPGLERAEEYRQKLAQMGVFGTLVPVDSGGSGLGLLDAALIGEEVGRACAPLCWHGLGTVAPLALCGGDDERPARYLSSLIKGDAVVGAALSHSLEQAPVVTGDRLEGLSLMATDAPGADAWVVEAAGSLHLLERDAEGLEVTAMPGIDSQRQFGSLSFGKAPVVSLPGSDAERILEAARIALAAESLGAAEHMLHRAVSYALEREQFGRLIGSFQSIKHLCAEMAAELEPVRALIWQAAHSWDLQSEETPWLACHAKAVMAEAATFIARTATEVHGGIGFTEEYGLHLWFKRIGCNRQLLGGPERLREEAARLQGWA